MNTTGVHVKVYDKIEDGRGTGFLRPELTFDDTLVQSLWIRPRLALAIKENSSRGLRDQVFG
jgi:hypothetical protein